MINTGVSHVRQPSLGVGAFPVDWTGAGDEANNSLARWLTVRRLAVLLICHSILGLVLRNVPGLGTAYAAAVLGTAVCIALFAKRAAWIVWAMGYITGADVLWRMCETAMPYEGAKYGICVLAVISLARMRRYWLSQIAIAYLVLMLPAIAISYNTLSVEGFRAGISFNFSGPLSLCSAVCFFTNVSLTVQEWKIALLSVIAPIMAIITIAAHGVFTNPHIHFATESVHGASGGFGPNQVSAVLGLGALLAVHYVMSSENLGQRIVVLTVATVFLMQAAFTFSRGGVIAAFLALLPAVYYRIRSSRKRAGPIISILALLAVCAFVIYPFVDNYTGGALTARYSVKDLNGREELMMADYRIWETNPVFGVGIGGSPRAHYELFGVPIATHNEFTRLLAEHGIFGVAAGGLVILMAALAFLRAPTAEERAYVSSFLLWSILFSGSNGMRIAAAGFIFGLAFVRLKRSRQILPGPGQPSLPEPLWRRS